jgi:hypothetical protein
LQKAFWATQTKSPREPLASLVHVSFSLSFFDLSNEPGQLGFLSQYRPTSLTVIPFLPSPSHYRRSKLAATMPRASGRPTHFPCRLHSSSSTPLMFPLPGHLPSPGNRHTKVLMAPPLTATLSPPCPLVYLFRSYIRFLIAPHTSPLPFLTSPPSLHTPTIVTSIPFSHRRSSLLPDRTTTPNRCLTPRWGPPRCPLPLGHLTVRPCAWSRLQG